MERVEIAVRLQFYAYKRLSRQYHKQLYDTQQQTNRMKTNKLQTNDQRTQSSMMHSRLYTFHKNPKQIPDACVVRPKRLHGAITTTRPTQTAHSIRNACTVNTTTTKLKVEIVGCKRNFFVKSSAKLIQTRCLRPYMLAVLAPPTQIPLYVSLPLGLRLPIRRPHAGFPHGNHALRPSTFGLPLGLRPLMGRLHGQNGL